MIIAETFSFAVGAYTVQQRPRPDNPGFPVFLIFKGEKLIGKQFSMPSESDCQWLSRQQNCSSLTYAQKSKAPRKHSTGGITTRNATLKVA